MGDLKNKTLSGVKWNAIGQFSTQGISFVIGILLARLLSPSDYGVVGMIGIFMAIAQTFIDSGFGSALIRKQDCTDADYSTAFYFNVVVGGLCYSLLFLSAPLVANFFKTPILEDVVRVISINLFCGALNVVQRAKLVSAVDFKTIAWISLISTCVSGAVGILMAYNGFGVWSLVYQQVSSSAVTTLLFWTLTKWYPKLIFSKESFKYLFGFGGKILSASLLHTIFCHLSTILIGRYYTSQDLGYYSRGATIATLPSSNISSILQSVTYPILSKIQDDDNRLIQVYRKYICITSMVIFFCMSLLAALASPFILFLLTEKWTDSIIYLQIFCVAYMFDHISRLNLNILYVKGRSDLVLRLEIIKKTISISMIAVAVPFGVLALCVAHALYSQIAIVINTYYTGKLFGLGYWSQVKDFSKYLIFSILSILPSFLISYTSLSPIFTLVLGGSISCLIYWLLIRKDSNFVELLNLVLKRQI